MKTLAKKTGFILSLLFVIHSCVTINIYFPAAAVEKAADEIVKEIWGEEGLRQEPKKEPSSEGPQSFIGRQIQHVFGVIGPEEAFAREADINVTTPEIRALKEAIKNRAGSLKKFMDNGNAGISNDGLLIIRTTEGLNLKDKAVLSRLVSAENKDRNALYSAIAKANNFSPDRVSDIKAIFAKSWMNNAKKGWWMQMTDGKWVQQIRK